MTYEKAIDVLYWALNRLDGHQYIVDGSGNVDVNAKTEAFGTAIETLKKQVPKNPIGRLVDIGYNTPKMVNIWVCPCCGIDTQNPRDLHGYEWWCPDCGQRLQWGD